MSDGLFDSTPHLRRALLAAALVATPAFSQPPADEGKRALVESVGADADSTWGVAQDLWKWAEPGYQETRSAERLALMLEEVGFRVERGVAGMPTGFVAEYGTGQPVIALLAEFDALPGLSQEAVPERRAREETTWGHGCGHHLFGPGSAAAAIAVAEQLKAGALQGTIRVYGTPAEEGGSAKTFMVRDGLFDDVDAALHWHPSSANVAGDPSNLARIAVKFRFRGRSAHAAGAPEMGRSALDAVELTAHAAQLLREHTPDFTRIHHVITSGGGAPNVVPDFAEVFFYVRHPDVTVVRSVYDRLVKCAEGGALATGTRLQVENIGGTHNLLPNETLTQVSLANLRALNDLEFDEEELQWAEKLQESLMRPRPLDSIREVRDMSGEISRGSTDVGDVSWVVPTTGIATVCWVPGTPAHSWQATAAGGMSIGRKGMLLAARTLAATAWDLFTRPELLAAAQQELERRREGNDYEALLAPGQQPPLNYRNAPKD
ncbi:MAG: amidohydrolase [Acidobacteriota bacterium]